MFHLIDKRHGFDRRRTQRYDADPDFLKEVPPEIAFLQDLAFADDLAHDAEYLFRIYWTFDLRLVVADDVQLTISDMMDAVHHISAVFSLKEDHVSPMKLLGRRRDDDGIAKMSEKRCHGASGHRHADFFPALDDIDEHRQIGMDIHDAAARHFRDLTILTFCFHSHTHSDNHTHIRIHNG